MKPENLLLDEHYMLKLSDFGFATGIEGVSANRLHYTCKGTLGYMAPELINIHVCEERGYNAEQTDVFAMGVILFSLVMGRPPFWKADPVQDRHYKIVHLQQFQFFWNIWESQYAQSLGIVIKPEIKQLFNAMVASVPAYRLTLNELREHPWVKNTSVKEDLVHQEMH